MYERICELCKDKNISITKLCEVITNSSGNLATWKKGYMRSDYLQKIAQYFGVSVDYLLGLSDKKGIRIVEVETVPDLMTAEFLNIFSKLSFKQKVSVINYAIELQESKNELTEN